MASKRAQGKEIKRNKVIDAAEHLFFSKGFAQTTMDDLCAQAHLSKRTLYVYFNSKDQLYFEIMIRGYKQLITMLEENQQSLPVIDRLKQMAYTVYQFSVLYPDYFTAIFSYENRAADFEKGVPDASKEECYRLGEQVFQKLTDLIEEGQNSGIFRRKPDAVQTAVILWSCLHGILNTAKVKKNYLASFHSIPSDSLIRQAFEVIIRSICIDSGGDC
ncbi:TetR/AcrR family transcriptional regulator [Sporolactobacillus sp. CPB3-1]|uniref:TetR/AcrR family transcriptional regulator n=1 Tax=Sporolactobacillus mangiferae TaxID=2940498 RepID=A0ABT0MCZ8_9BACL|nr:TetR/AcrR family transcriptional regulator [Sporolactobacillus mangiferae]MCL1632134.1 TetR/AcrR family transcriptional regulator [Sporolactobacillus mangiferae]